MGYGTKLFYYHGLYDIEGTEELFIKAVIENILHHQNACEEYHELLSRQGFVLESLRSSADLFKIPPLPTLFLKRHHLYSVSPEHLMFKSTSSGTSGTASMIGLDWPSLINWLGMSLGTASKICSFE